MRRDKNGTKNSGLCKNVYADIDPEKDPRSSKARKLQLLGKGGCNKTRENWTREPPWTHPDDASIFMLQAQEQGFLPPF